jgi:hypothetical protein
LKVTLALRAAGWIAYRSAVASAAAKNPLREPPKQHKEQCSSAEAHASIRTRLFAHTFDGSTKFGISNLLE